MKAAGDSQALNIGTSSESKKDDESVGAGVAEASTTEK